MTSAGRARRRWIAAGLVAMLAAGGGWIALRSRGAPSPAGDPDARAPDGVRIKVEVLNASRVHGLARRAMLYLRDRGFDVVEAGNADSLRDTTLVLDRSGHPDWAARVGKALGGAPVDDRPDSTRYVDVTVLLGAGWRPPAEPFHP